MMLVSVETAFNRIWSVREPRRGMSRFLLYWGILTLSPLLLGAGFAISLFSLPLVSTWIRSACVNDSCACCPAALAEPSPSCSRRFRIRVRLIDAVRGGVLHARFERNGAFGRHPADHCSGDLRDSRPFRSF